MAQSHCAPSVTQPKLTPPTPNGTNGWTTTSMYLTFLRVHGSVSPSAQCHAGKKGG